MRRHAVAIAVVAVLGLQSCLSTNLAKIGSEATFAPEDDERQLWSAARAAEDKVLPPAAEYRDPALETYLDGIVARLLPPTYAQAGGPPIRIRVRRDPRLNASAMPHGTIIIDTSIVARAENEAQVAGVLGHELSHITNRHSIREARTIKNRQNAITTAAILGTLALAVVAADQANRGNYGTAQAVANVAPTVLDFGLRLTYTAMVNGYSRDSETEADEEGLRRMAGAGYDPYQMGAFFRKLLSDSPDAGPFETFFYGSHPRTIERIQTVERLVPQLPVNVITAATTSDAVDFNQRTRNVRMQNAWFDAHAGRLTLARAQMSRVVETFPTAARPAAASFLEGNIYAAQSYGLAKRGDLAHANTAIGRAEVEYRRAMATAPALTADGNRALGSLYHGQRDVIHRDCRSLSIGMRQSVLEFSE